MDNDDYTAKMTELIELLRVIGNDTQQCEVKECNADQLDHHRDAVRVLQRQRRVHHPGG